MALNFGQVARSSAIAWKRSTATLPEEARAAADWVRDDGRVILGPFEFCLPLDHAAENLLPDARVAIELFSSLGIAWPGGIEGGPGNNLLDSWVQCANALVPLMADEQRLCALLGQSVDVAEILPIEHNWLVTFGWSGLADHLGEEGGGIPPRGPEAATTAPAAIRYRAPDGRVEVALLAWLYAESFRGSVPDPPRKLAARAAGFRTLIDAGPAPLFEPGVSVADYLVEPFDRLVRLQLLAMAMERSHELEADRVRVIWAAPFANTELAQSLTRPIHRRRGSTVTEVWRSVLHPEQRDRFSELDTACLVDERLDLTGPEFLARYGHLMNRGPAADGDSVWTTGTTQTPPLVTTLDRVGPSWDRRRRRP